MKTKWITLMTLFALGSQLAHASQCSDKYLETAIQIRENGKMGAMITDLYSYEEMLKFFDQDHVTSVITMTVLVAYFPVVLVMSGGVSAYAASKSSYLTKIGEALEGRDTKKAAKGLKKMYGLIRKEIEISQKDFEGFLENAAKSDSFCKYDRVTKLSEKGRERVGDAGFQAYLGRVHGTPEWDAFWKDLDNFEFGVDLAPLMTKKELKRALIDELIANGYSRKIH